MPTIKLYRAVKDDELDDITQTGEFKTHPFSIEGKYFCAEMVDVSKHARNSFRILPDEGEYTAVSGDLEIEILGKAAEMFVDGGIGAIVIYESDLPNITGAISYNYMEVPHENG